jgi:hypothetical protein
MANDPARGTPILWLFSEPGIGVALRYALEDRGVSVICPDSGPYTILPTHAALMLTVPGRPMTNWKRVVFERFSNSLELSANLSLMEQVDVVMDFLNRDAPPPCEQLYAEPREAAVA